MSEDQNPSGRGRTVMLALLGALFVIAAGIAVFAVCTASMK